MVGVEPHHKRGGMPAARDQAAVDTFLRSFRVRVIRQWNEALVEFPHFCFVNNDRAELVYGAGNVVFEITVVGGGERRSPPWPSQPNG